MLQCLQILKVQVASGPGGLVPYKSGRDARQRVLKMTLKGTHTLGYRRCRFDTLKGTTNIVNKEYSHVMLFYSLCDFRYPDPKRYAINRKP